MIITAAVTEADYGMCRSLHLIHDELEGVILFGGRHWLLDGGSRNSQLVRGSRYLAVIRLVQDHMVAAGTAAAVVVMLQVMEVVG